MESCVFFHLHAHVIPRREGDTIRLAPEEGHDPATLAAELPGVARKIREAIG
jgi:diadenosine tetraphosphate (Ap4A) HIT family hydrolase